jgi:negative regulator of sigma E activity
MSTGDGLLRALASSWPVVAMAAAVALVVALGIQRVRAARRDAAERVAWPRTQREGKTDGDERPPR